MALFTPEEVIALLSDPDWRQPALWRTIRTDVAEDAAEPLQNATTDVACFAVKLPTDRVGDETRHSSTDEQPEGCSIFYVSPPAGVTPSKKDILVIGEREYSIESLDLLAPAGTLLLITATVYE